MKLKWVLVHSRLLEVQTYQIKRHNYDNERENLYLNSIVVYHILHENYLSHSERFLSLLLSLITNSRWEKKFTQINYSSRNIDLSVKLMCKLEHELLLYNYKQIPMTLSTLTSNRMNTIPHLDCMVIINVNNSMNWIQYLMKIFMKIWTLTFWKISLWFMK